MHCTDVWYTSPIKDLVSFDESFAANVPKDAGTGADCFGEKFMLDVSSDTKTREQCGLDVSGVDRVSLVTVCPKDQVPQIML